MKKKPLQAYKQTPWRIQLQWIGVFLLALILIAAVTGVYLSINANAAATGRNIQFLENDIDQINNEIAELNTDLASSRSTKNMMSKAEEQGFTMMDMNQAKYLEIPGYDPEAGLALAPSKVNIIAESPIVKSSYKSSLWDWFVKQFWYISENTTNPEGDSKP
jgi:cell division protein FtsL